LAEATHLLGLPLKHKPKDIKPQGHNSGLDADKVDGLHANELGGGGPHASSHETGGGDKVHFADLEHDEGDATLHDAFTGTSAKQIKTKFTVVCMLWIQTLIIQEP